MWPSCVSFILDYGTNRLIQSNFGRLNRIISVAPPKIFITVITFLINKPLTLDLDKISVLAN